MSVALETSLGDIVIDLFHTKAPHACFNFLKLAVMKYYNDSLINSMQKDYICQAGMPSKGQATSVWGLVSGDVTKRYFDDEPSKRKFA